MRDRDVRLALSAWVQNHFAYDSTSFTVHELGVCSGSARIDLAVINGHLHGYEIKSDSDTLTRLPSQVEQYGAIFDYMTIVVGQKYVQKSMELIPSWWGVLTAQQNDCGSVVLVLLRQPHPNPSTDPQKVAGLLWKQELVDVLKNRENRFPGKPDSRFA